MSRCATHCALPTSRLLEVCATAHPNVTQVKDPTAATMIALRSLARRHAAVCEEIDALIAPRVEQINPQLLGLPGVGPDVAGQLLVTAGPNSDRLRLEAAFAMLCGVTPLPVSSGKTTRHRLNRGGDRDANSALWRIVVCRLKTDPHTRAYAHRRTTEGLSKPEIIRCLKRYLTREVFTALQPPADTRQTPDNHQPPPRAPDQILGSAA